MNNRLIVVNVKINLNFFGEIAIIVDYVVSYFVESKIYIKKML